MKFLVCVCAVLAVAAAGESKKDKRGIYGESLGYGYGSLGLGGLGGLDHGLAYSAPLSLGSPLSYGYSAPLLSKSYVSAPVISKTVIPAPIYKTVVAAPSPIYKTYAAAPLIKSYSAPIIKSYSAPIYKSYAAAPVIKSYAAPISLGHGYGYGLGDLSLGGHGLAYSSGLELGHGW